MEVDSSGYRISKWRRDKTRRYRTGKIRGRKECSGFSKSIYDRIKPYYNKKNNHRRPKGLKGYRDDHVPVPEILRHIINEIAQQVIENKAGVYIKGLGYFFIFSTPLDYDFKGNASRRVRVTNRAHRLCMIPTKDSPLRDYVIDFSNSPTMNRYIDDSIAAGNRYMNLSSTVLTYDELLYGYRYDYHNDYKKWVEDNEI